MRVLLLDKVFICATLKSDWHWRSRSVRANACLPQPCWDCVTWVHTDDDVGHMVFSSLRPGLIVSAWSVTSQASNLAPGPLLLHLESMSVTSPPPPRGVRIQWVSLGTSRCSVLSISCHLSTLSGSRVGKVSRQKDWMTVL